MKFPAVRPGTLRAAGNFSVPCAYIIRRTFGRSELAAQAGGEAALSALERALSSADGRRAVSSLSASHEALLRAAADRAASGDLSAARALARSLAATPEGARLADALRRSMGGSSRG